MDRHRRTILINRPCAVDTRKSMYVCTVTQRNGDRYQTGPNSRFRGFCGVNTHNSNLAHGLLFMMGIHGRTGLQHLLIGSVAERVVRLAPCPVMVVPGRSDKQ